MTKKGDLEKQMEKLREKMAKGDYKEKVPVKVQEQDAEKVGKINWVNASRGVWCEFLLNDNYLRLSSASAEPNRTWKSQRSHGQLQENDVTLPLAFCKSRFISSFSCLCINFQNHFPSWLYCGLNSINLIWQSCVLFWGSLLI